MKIATLIRDASDRTTIDVKLSAVAAVGGITGVVAAAISVFTFLLVTEPTSRSERELAEETFRLSVLRQGLSLEVAEDRARSLRLLLRSGVLEDPLGGIAAILDSPAPLPRWPAAAAGRGEPDARADPTGSR